MTYKETLDCAKEHGLRAYDLVVAQECDWAFNFDFDDAQFEKLCDKVANVYSHSMDVGVDACCVAMAVNRLIDDEGKGIEDVLQMDFYDIHNVALDYCEY